MQFIWLSDTCDIKVFTSLGNSKNQPTAVRVCK